MLNWWITFIAFSSLVSSTFLIIPATPAHSEDEPLHKLPP